MAKWKQVGEILKSKDSEGFYLKVKEDCVLEKDQCLTMKTPLENLESLRDNGVIDEEAFEARLEKIPSFVKYVVFQTPRKGE